MLAAQPLQCPGQEDDLINGRMAGGARQRIRRTRTRVVLNERYIRGVGMKVRIRSVKQKGW
jgi:hypothetical protein